MSKLIVMRPYKCVKPSCNKTYTTKFSLRRHVASHRAVQQYQCKVCDRRFALRQYLKEHSNIHTGERPFVCLFKGCGHSFRQAGKLSLHKRIHRNMVFYITKVKHRRSQNLKNCVRSENAQQISSSD